MLAWAEHVVDNFITVRAERREALRFETRVLLTTARGKTGKNKIKKIGFLMLSFEFRYGRRRRGRERNLYDDRTFLPSETVLSTVRAISFTVVTRRVFFRPLYNTYLWSIVIVVVVWQRVAFFYCNFIFFFCSLLHRYCN